MYFLWGFFQAKTEGEMRRSKRVSQPSKKKCGKNTLRFGLEKCGIRGHISSYGDKPCF